MAVGRANTKMRQRLINRYFDRRRRMYVKVAPGRRPGYHSMSRPEHDALWEWICAFRTFMRADYAAKQRNKLEGGGAGHQPSSTTTD